MGVSYNKEKLIFHKICTSRSMRSLGAGASGIISDSFICTFFSSETSCSKYPRYKHTQHYVKHIITLNTSQLIIISLIKAIIKAFTSYVGSLSLKYFKEKHFAIFNEKSNTNKTKKLINIQHSKKYKFISTFV